MVSLRLRNFKFMSLDGRQAAIESFAKGASSADETLKRLDEQIATFETSYKLPSSSLIAQISEGLIKETQEINEWLMLIHLRDGIIKYQTVSSQSSTY